MTRCNATAYLVDADMRVIPDITVVCELELAEVLDPDESFDLEVDIAPAETIREQRIATEGVVIELALHRCSVCGLEPEPECYERRNVDRVA